VSGASEDELRGRRVVLRPAVPQDLPALSAILDEPEVRRWWGSRSADELRERLTGAHDDAIRLAVEVDGEVAGLIQYDEEDDPDYRHAGIDVFLGRRWHGRGLGQDAVRTLARHLVEVRGHHRLTIDPSATNEAAIRCYEAVGFRRVGVLRRYERAEDGSWRDGLLLDLLASDVGWTPAGS
jgi:aminoglycoside 6'-N-acetyltransferase